ncbi:carbohydrate ABC transporter permease [Paenibacillus sp. BC26]|uniref:carbohydrate ABC transporter permease n=1 Tax=Paenibacillus sp. BC26 TaxID=1881032 RepID=UPI0008DED619|nr:carbohydrate ABC transporter permease [Paenibacillus sp. BC26]SFS45817.1 putative aldouronate transport system permease protein [Paenibacillus sp. BC26]
MVKLAKKRESFGDQVFNVSLYVIMVILMLVTLYPFWSQVVLSFEAGSAAYSTGFLLIPSKFTFESYKLALEYKMLWIGYGNTILRTVTAVILSITVTSLTAYPLSKKGLPFNQGFTLIILFTMLFGGGLIPNYLLIKNLGLYDSMWALILPGTVSAFNVLIMRNFFRSIPESLEESAKVDGAGHFRIFSTIILPLSTPVLATVALWVGVAHWNAWFDGMIYISDPNKQVLQVILRRIIVENNVTDLNALLLKMQNKTSFTGRQLQATMIMFSIIPMLIVYPFVQKYFAKGIMIGAIKG